jgi:hypothetical protein
MVNTIISPRAIELRAKYFLSDAGLAYCIGHRIPLREMHSHSNERSSGFEWGSCRIDSLMRLAADDFLSAVEMDRPEFVTVRAPLVALIRTLLTGLLVSRFKSELQVRISAGSGAIGLSSGAPLSRGTAAAARLGKKGWVDSLLAALAQECERGAAAESLPSEEGDLSLRCARLCSAIDEETMLLLALGGRRALGLAARIVLAYAGRMGIAEYLALMVVEFIQLAEKSYLQNLAERDRYVRAHPQELPRLLANSSFREKLLEIAARRGESMQLRVAFTREPAGAGASQRMEITTRTRGLIGYASRNEVVNRRIKVVKTMDMGALLKLAAGNDSCAELGLVYHSNLGLACEGVGMGFSSKVVLDEGKDETLAVMSVMV